jgi:hypothetical protein
MWKETSCFAVLETSYSFRSNVLQRGIKGPSLASSDPCSNIGEKPLKRSAARDDR